MDAFNSCRLIIGDVTAKDNGCFPELMKMPDVQSLALLNSDHLTHTCVEHIEMCIVQFVADALPTCEIPLQSFLKEILDIAYI